MVFTEKETILLNKFQPGTIGRNDLLGQLPKGVKNSTTFSFKRRERILCHFRNAKS